MNNHNYCVYVHISPSNKVYIGYTGKNPPSKRWGENGSAYKGNSKDGTIFYKAILKYGWHNFTHKILKDNLTLKEAHELEKYYISLYNSTDQDFGYNQTKGGIGGKGGSKKGRIMSDSFKEKRRLATIGKNNPRYGQHCSTETKLKISKSNSGRKMTEEQRKHISDGHLGHPGWNKGIKYTEEQKKNFGKKIKGRKWITNGINDKVIDPIELEYFLSQGWRLGKTYVRKGWKMTEEQKEKLRRPKSEEHKKKLSEIQKKKILEGTANFGKGTYFGLKSKEEFIRRHGRLPKCCKKKVI